ncbi:zinc ribbon domain-containing protein [Acidobacterium sp. S8]|uniref:zinc ribbon domain-containing protein n=1 Tax=Acidobacterium sp. S8 TaxID=1641854 RepID=UPI00131E2E5B|nr:zinc ribbon domain-containing protein [Acidobacterium sp. S8]
MAARFPLREHQETTFSSELKLIPRWSVAAAILIFVVMQYLFWVVFPQGRHHPPAPMGLRIYFALSWGALASLYMLMVGYVSNDSPRRGMSARIWMVICLVMPGGIGAVLYFLLRQPVISLCPACGTRVESEYHFCPQCAYQVSASCGKCYRSVRITDLYCVHCGHDLVSDNRPARLHAFQS